MSEKPQESHVSEILRTNGKTSATEIRKPTNLDWELIETQKNPEDITIIVTLSLVKPGSALRESRTNDIRKRKTTLDFVIPKHLPMIATFLSPMTAAAIVTNEKR